MHTSRHTNSAGHILKKRASKYFFQFLFVIKLLATNSPLIKKKVFTATEPIYVNGNILLNMSKFFWPIINAGACPHITNIAQISRIKSRLFLSLCKKSATVRGGGTNSLYIVYFFKSWKNRNHFFGVCLRSNKLLSLIFFSFYIA